MTDAIAPAKCPRCDDAHALIRCPYVKAMEFEDGDVRLIRRVEFLTPADFPATKSAKPEAPAEDYPKLGQLNAHRP